MRTVTLIYENGEDKLVTTAELPDSVPQVYVESAYNKDRLVLDDIVTALSCSILEKLLQEEQRKILEEESKPVVVKCGTMPKINGQ